MSKKRKSWKINGYRVVDMINPRKWWAIVDAKLARRYTDKAFMEQVVYRMTQCPECVAAGKCLDCSCPVPNNMLARGNKCSEGRWDEMYNEETWNSFKEKRGIKISI